MLRRILFASAGAMVLSGAALAADLAPPPVYLPPPPPPMWTGFYIGLNAGGTWTSSNSVNVASAPLLPGIIVAQISALPNSIIPVSTGGFIGGGQIGYNFQFGTSWVAGIEADIQGVAGATHSATAARVGIVGGVPVNTFISASKSLDYLGTVRGRIGFLFTPTFLNGSGGLAYGGINTTDNVFQSAPANGFFGAGRGQISGTLVGWTAGGGVEWMFHPNWSVKVEYLYYDLGSVTSTSPLVAINPVPPVVGSYALTRASTRFNGNIVRAGVNYNFNWGYPAPVVAKY
jgi:outer membrane immunogenic protein